MQIFFYFFFQFGTGGPLLAEASRDDDRGLDPCIDTFFDNFWHNLRQA